MGGGEVRREQFMWPDGRDAELFDRQGWATVRSSREHDFPEVPEHLGHLLVEGIFEGRRDMVVYDPSRTELKTTHPTNKAEPSKQELLDAGWEILDANIARMIWIRKKQELTKE